MQATWSWFRVRYVTKKKIRWLMWHARNVFAGLWNYCLLDAEFDECQGIKVWLDQEEAREVSSKSVCLCAGVEQDKWAQGWVDMLVMDENGNAIAAPDGYPAVERVYDWVMWKREDE